MSEYTISRFTVPLKKWAADVCLFKKSHAKLAGARRVREPVEVAPCRLGLEKVDPHPTSFSCFPPSPEFQKSGRYICLSNVCIVT